MSTLLPTRRNVTRAKTAGVVALGAVPRAHLMPPELETAKKVRARIGRLGWAVALIVVLVLAGVGFGFVQLTTANAALASEQSRAALLVVEQGKYAAVTTIQSQMAAITQAQPVAASGEILWMEYVAKVQATLPPGTTISAFTGELAALSAPQVLQAPHIAILSLTADSPQASVSDWLDNMAQLDGFVDATPGNVVLVPETGRYQVQVDLLINEAVLAYRFDPEALKQQQDAATAGSK